MGGMYDVIIVGAGPAGLYSARLLGKRFRVLILEEHGEIGKPVQCSGLISKNLERFVEIDCGFVENTISGAILHSGKTHVKLEKPGPAAWVINREKFDCSLARDIKSEILLGTEADKIDVKENHVSVKAGGKEFKSKMILGCDGPGSVVRNHFMAKPQETLKGVIAIKEVINDSKFVELWFDKTSVPDGFFWKIPRGQTTEYGMLSAKADFKRLERFFNLRGYEKRAGLIPMGFQKTFFPRTLLVGDAASQVKPWSGGGVIYGLTCAGIAADVVKKAIEEDNFSEEFLEEYETRWKKEIGKNITLGLMFREFYKDMDKKGLEKFFDKIKNKSLSRLDMDFPIGILE